MLVTVLIRYFLDKLSTASFKLRWEYKKELPSTLYNVKLHHICRRINGFPTALPKCSLKILLFQNNYFFFRQYTEICLFPKEITVCCRKKFIHSALVTVEVQLVILYLHRTANTSALALMSSSVWHPCTKVVAPCRPLVAWLVHRGSSNDTCDSTIPEVSTGRR